MGNHLYPSPRWNSKLELTSSSIHWWPSSQQADRRSKRSGKRSWQPGAWTKNCSIGALDARHILIVLDSEQEARKVLTHPSRKLGHALFQVFRWSKDFDTKKESSVTTTWIRLMNLPPGMFNQGYIDSIVTSFSKFIAVDGKTATLNNPCYARVCVELDITKSLPESIWINTGGDEGFWQQIVYENRLLFCTRCKLHGHSLENCRKALQRRIEEQQIWAGRDEHGLLIVYALVNDVAGIAVIGQNASEIKPPPVDSDHAWTLVQRRNYRTPYEARVLGLGPVSSPRTRLQSPTPSPLGFATGTPWIRLHSVPI
ncbi:hypothetical protein QQ045_009025 [Rhodiola kirilowii]